MRCLVTGASGHLGAALARRLLADGADVTILVRPSSNLWRLEDAAERVTVLRGDLTNLMPAEEGIRQARPEIVFHLAWQGVTAAERDSPAQITGNLVGSLSLWEMAREAGARCWVGVGSQAEYGVQDGLLHEEMPPRPVSTYGTAKLCTGLLTERLCAMAGMRFVWLRLLATYGPMDDERHLIPAVIMQLLLGRRPALTPGEQRWDYLYIDDAVEAILRVAQATEAQGVFNLGSGEAHTVREIIEQVRDLIDPGLPLGFGDVPYGANQIMHLQADISRLRAATGWSPRTGLAEGLRRTVEWHRSMQAAQ